MFRRKSPTASPWLEGGVTGEDSAKEQTVDHGRFLFGC
jgi:hypothetical protein